MLTFRQRWKLLLHGLLIMFRTLPGYGCLMCKNHVVFFEKHSSRKRLRGRQAADEKCLEGEEEKWNLQNAFNNHKMIKIVFPK